MTIPELEDRKSSPVFLSFDIIRTGSLFPIRVECQKSIFLSKIFM